MLDHVPGEMARALLGAEAFRGAGPGGEVGGDLRGQGGDHQAAGDGEHEHQWRAAGFGDHAEAVGEGVLEWPGRR